MATGVDKILRQLGGTPDKNKTGVDQIVEILENGGGGGGAGLPSVDGSDNGKVLTVVSGSWAAANPSGGGALLVSMTWVDDSTATLDKNFSEIKSALLGGRLVSILDSNDEGSYTTCYISFATGYEETPNEDYVIVVDAFDADTMKFHATTSTGVLTVTIES